MAYKWKIIKAAVEQLVAFPSETDLNNYIKKLDNNKYAYEIVHKTQQEDGALTVLIRKQYNYNEFLCNNEMEM